MGLFQSKSPGVSAVQQRTNYFIGELNKAAQYGTSEQVLEQINNIKLYGIYNPEILNTALLYATVGSNLNTIATLLDNWANNISQAFYYAINRQDDVNVLNLLSQYNDRYNVDHIDYEKALYEAVYKQRPRSLEYILQNREINVDSPYVRNAYNYVAYKYTSYNGKNPYIPLIYNMLHDYINPTLLR